MWLDSVETRINQCVGNAPKIMRLRIVKLMKMNINVIIAIKGAILLAATAAKRCKKYIRI